MPFEVRTQRAVLLLAAATLFLSCSSDRNKGLELAVAAGDVASVRQQLAAAKADGARVDLQSLYLALTPSRCGEAESEILRAVIAADPQPFSLGRVQRERAVDRLMTLQSSHKKNSRYYYPAELVSLGRCAPLVKVLFESGLRPKSDGVRSALVSAAADGRLDMAEALLAGGADPNAPGVPRSATTHLLALKESPLEAARKAGQARMVEYLVSRGAR